MFDKSVYVNRRKRLISKMSGGLVLILFKRTDAPVTSGAVDQRLMNRLLAYSLVRIISRKNGSSQSISTMSR